jgi:hypothetical protein
MPGHIGAQSAVLKHWNYLLAGKSTKKRRKTSIKVLDFRRFFIL